MAYIVTDKDGVHVLDEATGEIVVFSNGTQITLPMPADTIDHLLKVERISCVPLSKPAVVIDFIKKETTLKNKIKHIVGALLVVSALLFVAQSYKVDAADIIRGLTLQLATASTKTTATTNATITPKATLVTVDTFRNLAISTANVISTVNAQDGQFIILQSKVASQDVVIVEGGNIVMTAASFRLSDPADKVMLIYRKAAQRWETPAAPADNN
jgi:hypothetical protein